MVRRGSPVRVRKRASEKSLLAALFERRAVVVLPAVVSVGNIWETSRCGCPGRARPLSTPAQPRMEPLWIPGLQTGGNQGDVRSLCVEHRTHVLPAGLYAFKVVPRAPNFCALRRVSSNLERA